MPIANGDRDPIKLALVDALSGLTRYVEQREVPDDIADDDCRALEEVASCLQSVPEDCRAELVDLIGHELAISAGLIEVE